MREQTRELELRAQGQARHQELVGLPILLQAWTTAAGDVVLPE